MTHTDLVNSGVVSPCLTGKFIIGWSLCPGYSPVICPSLSGIHRLSWDPRWSREGMALGNTSLAAVIDSMKVKGVRPRCLVLKDHLKKIWSYG